MSLQNLLKKKGTKLSDKFHQIIMPEPSKMASEYKYGFSVRHRPVFEIKPGLNEKVVEQISWLKSEPTWMRDSRLASYRVFTSKAMPQWGPDLSKIDFNTITYFIRSTVQPEKSWQKLPAEIKKTYDLIGVPQIERKFLSGLSAQFESEVVYRSFQKTLRKLGVIFTDMDTALKEYPDVIRRYFGTLVPAKDNKFAALNSAVWSGGSFVWVPKGVRINLPLQAYFRINAPRFGQFERTLIIAEEGSYLHYIEGCTAPVYTTCSLHAAVVEIFAKKGARVQYTTLQNWSKNVYNLVTKRAMAQEESLVEWIDCNIGSKINMKYPSVYLAGKGARAEMLSVALAGRGQHQDAGAKMLHLAPYTSSRILSKSISRDGGRASFRGMIRVSPGAKKSRAEASCHALILDQNSRADTYPDIKVEENDAQVQHEATVQKISEEQLFYLTSRGAKKEEAQSLLVHGFIEPVAREIPFEYSIELNRLIDLEMSDNLG